MDTNYLENTKKINKDDKESGGQCQVEGNNVKPKCLICLSLSMKNSHIYEEMNFWLPLSEFQDLKIHNWPK